MPKQGCSATLWNVSLLYWDKGGTGLCLTFGLFAFVCMVVCVCLHAYINTQCACLCPYVCGKVTIVRLHSHYMLLELLICPLANLEPCCSPGQYSILASPSKDTPPVLPPDVPVIYAKIKKKQVHKCLLRVSGCVYIHVYCGESIWVCVCVCVCACVHMSMSLHLFLSFCVTKGTILSFMYMVMKCV